MQTKFMKPVLYATAAATALWAVGTSAQAGDNGGLQAWAHGAGTAVEKSMSYPKMAVTRGEEGTAAFKVTIDSDGNVVDTERSKSSGSSFINAAARSALKRTKFPALPSDVNKDELTFSLQLTYAIAGSATEQRALEREGYVTGREVAKARSPMFASIRIEEDKTAD